MAAVAAAAAAAAAAAGAMGGAAVASCFGVRRRSLAIGFRRTRRGLFDAAISRKSSPSSFESRRDGCSPCSTRDAKGERKMSPDARKRPACCSHTNFTCCCCCCCCWVPPPRCGSRTALKETPNLHIGDSTDVPRVSAAHFLVHPHQLPVSP